MELPPGSSASPSELRVLIPVREVVGTPKFSIIHFFRATVRLNGDSTTIPAGRLALPKLPPAVEPLAGLTFRAETRVVGGRPKQLRTWITIMNTSARRVRIHYGNCSAYLRAYRHAHRSGRPVWYEGRLPGKDPRTGMLTRVCDLYGLNDIIEPGDSLVVQNFQLEPTVPEVLGDSLPEGRYFFTAVFEIGTPPSKTRELPAGSAVLTR